MVEGEDLYFLGFERRARNDRSAALALHFSMFLKHIVNHTKFMIAKMNFHELRCISKLRLNW